MPAMTPTEPSSRFLQLANSCSPPGLLHSFATAHEVVRSVHLILGLPNTDGNDRTFDSLVFHDQVPTCEHVRKEAIDHETQRR